MTLEHCYQQCDQLDTGCCGFALLSVVGDLLCVYYSQCGALGPAQDHNLVGFYSKGAAGPSPPPGPLPPPPPPPGPLPPPPPAPPTFECTFETDVNGGSPIVISVNRSAAPIGVDHFYMLSKVGFYNNSAFFRYAPGFVVQFGISGNGTLDDMCTCKPSPNLLLPAERLNNERPPRPRHAPRGQPAEALHAHTQERTRLTV